MTYKATDDDLPDFFRTGVPPPPPKIDVRKRAEAAVLAHYPAVTEKRKKQLARAERKAKAEGQGLYDKKIFLRLAKKEQMYDWLRGLEETFPAMNFREQDFCGKLLAKFRKYKPERCKWITQKQYDWLKTIAATYIMLPREARNPSFTSARADRGKVPPSPSPRPSKTISPTCRKPTMGASRAHSAASGCLIGGRSRTTSKPRATEYPGLSLFLPCKPTAQKDQVIRLRITAMRPDRYFDSRYVCDCGIVFMRRKQIEKHLGLVPNVPATCSKFHRPKNGE